MSTCDTKVALNSVIKTTGVIANLAISDEDRLRIIVSNSTGGNTILIKGKILGQLDSGDILATITGDTKQVVNISTYDNVIIECTSFASVDDYVRVIISSFNEAGVSTAIDGTAGTRITDADLITFTSSDGSVQVVTDNINKTIDLISTGGAGSVHYIKDFAIGDWTFNGVDYILTVPQSVYGIAKTNPIIQTYENILGDLSIIFPYVHKATNNDIILQVSGSPDNRFNGRIIIL